MAWPASVDRIVFVAGVIAATASGWAALASLADGYAAPLCGVSFDGLVGLAALVTMWSLMVTTMMLPVTLVLVGGRSVRADLTFALGYLVNALVPAWGAALAEWATRSLGTTPDMPGMQIVLVAVAALGIVRDSQVHRSATGNGFHDGLAIGHAHLGACTAMVALQLAFGSMDLLLMAALALWMLAGAMMPHTRTLRRT